MRTRIPRLIWEPYTNTDNRGQQGVVKNYGQTTVVCAYTHVARGQYACRVFVGSSGRHAEGWGRKTVRTATRARQYCTRKYAEWAKRLIEGQLGVGDAV